MPHRWQAITHANDDQIRRYHLYLWKSSFLVRMCGDDLRWRWGIQKVCWWDILSRYTKEWGNCCNVNCCLMLNHTVFSSFSSFNTNTQMRTEAFPSVDGIQMGGSEAQQFNFHWVSWLTRRGVTIEMPAGICPFVLHQWLNILTHWGRDKMAAIFQTTFSNAFSWVKMFKCRLMFHWNLFPRVQLTIFHHWFR